MTSASSGSLAQSQQFLSATSIMLPWEQWQIEIELQNVPQVQQSSLPMPQQTSASGPLNPYQLMEEERKMAAALIIERVDEQT